jgi:hypothetical protein
MSKQRKTFDPYFLNPNGLWLPDFLGRIKPVSNRFMSRRRCCCGEESSSSASSLEYSSQSSASSQSSGSQSSQSSWTPPWNCEPCYSHHFMAVTTAGITNISCTDCSSLNRTYVLEASGANDCWWYLSLAGVEFCGGTLLENSLARLYIGNEAPSKTRVEFGIDLYLPFYIGLYNTCGLWFKPTEVPSAMTCEEVDGHVIPWNSNYGPCCYDGTATVYTSI